MANRSVFIRAGPPSTVTYVTGNGVLEGQRLHMASCGATISDMITAYIAEALCRARYELVDGGVFCATVPGLRGVVATASSVEACRTQLAEVIEAWILVRVARGLSVPALGRMTVRVKQAS